MKHISISDADKNHIGTVINIKTYIPSYVKDHLATSIKIALEQHYDAEVTIDTPIEFIAKWVVSGLSKLVISVTVHSEQSFKESITINETWLY